MSSAVERFDDKARDAFDRIGQNEVYVGELQRHRVYTRFLHWMVALFFFLALFTGFGIYLPWLFRWFTPIFGGGARPRTAPVVRGRICNVFQPASAELDRSDEVDGC